MKAIVVKEYGDESVLEYVETDKPAAGPGQVLVEIKAAGVNPVDTYIRQGNHPTAPPVPFTPGKDAAGVVVEAGTGVSKAAPEDRVYLAGALSGTYAEFALCNEDQVWKLPENSSFEEGAGVFVPYATAFRALFNKAGITAEDRILIHGGSGAVGIAAIQWAKNTGAEVFGTAGSPEGLRLVREVGADAVFDHGEEDYLSEILEATKGEGVTVILEMLANVNLTKDFFVLAKFGRIVVIGSRGSLDFDPRLTMGKEATIKGMSLFNASKEEFEEIHSAIFEGLSQGYLKPVVGRSFELSAVGTAHREIIESKAQGKIVLIP
ncbi:MAG: NADPH:quinone reductase [Pyrinomonadaceae bacterium]|nr:NADPH:quinone reductase [Pyrinomonadaceae bacterium]